MTTQQAVSLETVLPTLSTSAMQAFCQDLDGMLGISMTCAPSGSIAGTLEAIQSFFPKCAVVYSVGAQGTLEGQFDLILDKAGLFLLSGLIVMLPADKIKEQCKQGTLDSARKQMDTLKEIGNLLIGSWDRIYREQLTGHKHLLQNQTQIVDPWENPQETFGMDVSSPCLGIVWDITVQDHSPFKCAAVFPALSPAPSQAAGQPPAAAEEAPPPQPEPQKAVAPAPAQPPAQPEANPAPPAEPAEQTTHPVSEAIVQMTQSAQESRSPFDMQILNRPARLVMQSEVLWLSPNDSVETALQRMQQHNTPYALVEEQDRIEGILSRGDLRAAVSPYLRSPFESYRRPLDDASLQIRIKWFMSHPVHMADPEMPLWKIMETLCRHQVRALPVQDSKGAVVGLITVPDIFRTLTGLEMNPQAQSVPAPNQPSPDQEAQPAQEEK